MMERQQEEDERQRYLLDQLNELILNGIEFNKSLRQPSLYSKIDKSELKAESFAIVSDLLNSRYFIWKFFSLFFFAKNCK